MGIADVVDPNIIVDPDKHHVVVRLDDLTFEQEKLGHDVFLIFNRKKGPNAGVYEYEDRVTIVQLQGSRRDHQSTLLGGISDQPDENVYRLSSRGSWKHQELVIVVCEIHIAADSSSTSTCGSSITSTPRSS